MSDAREAGCLGAWIAGTVGGVERGEARPKGDRAEHGLALPRGGSPQYNQVGRRDRPSHNLDGPWLRLHKITGLANSGQILKTVMRWAREHTRTRAQVYLR